jgi:hypothetical protein
VKKDHYPKRVESMGVSERSEKEEKFVIIICTERIWW